MTKPEIDATAVAIDRACLAVGRFFYHWAFLESAVESVIIRLFDIDFAEGWIVTADMNFGVKLNIVSTALEWNGRNRDETWRRRARKLIARIGRLNGLRNLIAHHRFSPLKNGGVKFHKVEVKGEFDLPRIEWSAADFRRTNDLLSAVSAELTELTARSEHSRALIRALLRQQPRSALYRLMSVSPPMPPSDFSVHPAQGISAENLQTAKREVI